MNAANTLLLVDGNNVACPAWHRLKATPDGIPVSPQGRPLASSSIVLKTVLGLLKRMPEITAIAIVFDNDQPTFRHDRYPPYKAKRDEKDAQMVRDILLCQKLMERLGIAVTAPIGYEADDVIATLAVKAQEQGQPVLLYSSDRDLFQLVSLHCTILCPDHYKHVTAWIQLAEVVEKFGVLPQTVPDYKALVGDSDNIPGVKGMGPKTAIPLLQRFPAIESIYDNIGKITGRPYRLLKQPGAKAEALLFKELATLVTTLDLPEQDFRVSAMQVESVTPVLRNWGLLSLAVALENVQKSVKP